MSEFNSFGEFLKEKRFEKDITLREMARKLDVSAAFLSDVEKNRTAPLTNERLVAVANILDLSPEDKTVMFDLVGKQKKTVAPDVTDYVQQMEVISKALRKARDSNADEQFWLKLIEDLEKREG